MTAKELRERIAKIIDQLKRGETTSHIVEELRKSDKIFEPLLAEAEREKIYQGWQDQ